MNEHRHTTWRAGAKAVSLAIATLTAWAFVGSLGAQSPDWSSPPAIAVAILLVLWVSTCAAALLWIAWRLWRHWSAGTVRIVTGSALAILSLYSYGVLNERLSARWITDVLDVPLLLLAAFAYRWTSRAVIRSAGLEDPLDVHGHAAGHMDRVKAFSGLLAFCVWTALTGIFAEALRRDRNFMGPIAFLSSFPISYAVYRLTLWRLTPATPLPLPPGHGFDVLPVQPKSCRDAQCPP